MVTHMATVCYTAMGLYKAKGLYKVTGPYHDRVTRLSAYWGEGCKQVGKRGCSWPWNSITKGIR